MHQDISPIIIIPARMESTRFPGKPLKPILGKPMVQWVYEKAIKSGVGPVVIATCNMEIKEHMDSLGAKTILTDPHHPSGSDRIFEALEKYDPQNTYSHIICLQGDVPTISPTSIHDTLTPFKSLPDIDISTLCTKIEDEKEYMNPNNVKVALSMQGPDLGYGIYFSRSPLISQENLAFHHVGIYGYKRESLKKYVSCPEGNLEKAERLEQLRALQNHMRIGVKIIKEAPLGVDQPEDIPKAEKYLQKHER